MERENYVHVTTLLKPLAQFIGVDEDVLSYAQKRGTEIHKAIQMDAEDLAYPLNPEFAGYFKSYQKWLGLTEYAIEQSEMRLYDDKMRITGCIDAIATNGKKRFIVDWKNTASQNREYWELQGNFYYHLATINGLDVDNKISFVQLIKEGCNPKVFSFEASEVSWRQCLKYYTLYFSKKSF